MRFTTRREFLRASTAAVLSAAVPVDIFAQAAAAPSVSSSAWDSGSVSHLLPTVSDTRMLIKASFKASLEGTPRLRVGDHTVQGRMGDTQWRTLALLRDSTSAGTALSAFAHQQHGPLTVPALGARDVSKS